MNTDIQIVNLYQKNRWYKNYKTLLFGKPVDHISLYKDKDGKRTASLDYKNEKTTIILHGEEMIGDWFE